MRLRLLDVCVHHYPCGHLPQSHLHIRNAILPQSLAARNGQHRIDACISSVRRRAIASFRVSAVTSGNAVKDQAQDEQVKKLQEAAQARFDSIVANIKNNAAQKQSNTTTVSDGNAALQRQLEAAVTALQEGLVERDTEVRLLLLAALAGEHILFIGPPGTAKSELGRRLARLYHGTFFERLLTRFSVPEELFGPLSMRALEEDKYVRQTEGYLPSAKVAFIDEIFKANSAILNTLLTILNERLFDNGSARLRVPLICLVGASNELPESEELDALYDRFLIRRRVGQVSAAGLSGLLTGSQGTRSAATPSPATNGSGAPASLDDIALPEEKMLSIREEALANVAVPEEIVNLLADVRIFLQDKCEPPVYVSDRRLVKAVGLMQVAAYTSGRLAVNKFDCLLLQHVLWQRPDESQRIADFVLERLAVDNNAQQTDYLFNGMFMRACQATSSKDLDEKARKNLADLLRDVSELRKALEADLASAMWSGDGGQHNGLWLGLDETAAAATAMKPKMQTAAKAIKALLFEVVALEVALGSDTAPATLDLVSLLPQRWAAFLRNSQSA